MPPLHADVVPVLNQRAADQVADQMERQFGEAGRDGAASFNRMFSDGMSGLRGVGVDAGAQLRTGLRSGIDDAVADYTRGFGAMGDAANSAYAGLSRGAGLAAVGIAGIGVAAVAVGQQLYDLGSRWDDISDGIAIRTGMLGDDLDRITGMVRDLGAETAAPLESIGDIAGRVSQAMGLTGNDLREMAQRIADLNQMTGQQTDIRQLGKTFRIFDVAEGDSQLSALDSLLNASQATGASINELIETMNTAGKATSQFGLGFGETAALLATFEEAGVEATKVGPAMTIALKNFAAAGREPQQALRDTITEIENLADAGRDAEATALAAETFGRGYIDFLNAIKSGTLDVEALTKALKLLGPTIPELREQTADWAEEWQELKNKMANVFAPAAEGVFGTTNAGLTEMGDGLSHVGDVIGGLGTAWEQVAAAISGNPIRAEIVTGAFTMGPDGKLIPIAGPAPGANPFAGQGAGPGATTPGSLDEFLGIPPTPTGPNIPMPRGGAAGGSIGTDLPTGPISDWSGRAIPQGAGSSGSTGLPDAPVVPYAPLPGLEPGLAMTSGLYSAQSAVADAETKAAEKQARLNQLRASNVATDDERLRAENEAFEAERAAEAARMRFAEAQKSAFEQQYKQMDQMSADLESFGAKIDDDFGASDGLAGIAENVTKFIANLAFAPAYGALAAVREANGFGQGEAGSGLVGGLAASGMFGDQYRAVPRWARDQYGGSAATGPASAAAAYAGGGAYGGDAALLANVPAGRYVSQPGVGDLAQGIGDCSSAVEDLVNILDGRPTGGRSMSTGNAAEWLAERGFQPGMGGPGDFRVGFNPSHMQATLPDGTPFNWGSDSAAANRGIGGTGAYDPAFTDHWFRPAGGVSPAVPAVSAPTVPAAAAGGPVTPNLVIPSAGTPYNTDPGLTSPTTSATSPIAGAAQAAAGVGTPIGPPNLAGVPSLAGGPLSAGMPTAAPFSRGAAPSQSVSGGRAFAQGLPESGGIGFDGGGLIGLAASAAKSAAGAAGMAGMGMDGGAGGQVAAAVADMGIQQFQRAAAAAGQYAGALAGGAIETFSLNGSALGDPSASWLGRIAAAVPGVRPALPNTAGMLGGAQNPNMAEAGKDQPPDAMQPPGPLTPEQAAAQQASQGGGTDNSTNDNSTNITIQNPQTRDLDGSVRDVQTALGNSAAARQPR